jgi:fructokinase
MILCCGEALIDMIPVVGPDGQAAFAPLSGGAIFNTSIALGRLDIPVGLLSGISNDLLGMQLADELCTSKVSSSLLIRSDRPTTLAFVKLTNGHAEYTFYDENSAGRLIKASDLPDLPKTVSTVYFGGISLCAEPAASTYETLFLREAATRVTMIDPNIRPSFITDEVAYRARLGRMISAADIVKVSDEDLDWIVPSDAALEAKVETLHQMGAKIVIVTKGSDGASAYVYGEEAVHVSVPKVNVVDTVGAGDTFNAGFLAKLSQMNCLSKTSIKSLSTDQICESLEYAVQVAAITVSRKGANPPFLAELNVK